jgi:diguanylate cyclase (GGDEF)-like protein
MGEIPKPYTPEEEVIQKKREKVDLMGEDLVREFAEDENKLRDELGKEKKENLIDGLTGLNNRKALDQQIPEFLKKLTLDEKRSEKGAALLILDLDNFKSVNDTFGHPAGDEVLRSFAKILADSVKRSSDKVYRYGGEEFAVYLSDIGITEANKIAEEIRKNVADAVITAPDKSGNPVKIQRTVSIGLSHIKQLPNMSDTSSQELIRYADAALYKSKNLEKNIVTIYEPGMELDMDKK